METTITILKQHAPMALMLLAAVIYLQNDLGGDIQELRTDMAEEFTATRAEMGEELTGVRSEIAGANEPVEHMPPRPKRFSSFAPSFECVYVCKGAGRGWVYSTPSTTSATRCSGASSTS